MEPAFSNINPHACLYLFSSFRFNYKCLMTNITRRNAIQYKDNAHKKEQGVGRYYSVKLFNAFVPI